MLGRLLMIALVGIMVLPVMALAQEHPQEQPTEHPTEHPTEKAAEMPMGAPAEMEQLAAMDGVYDVAMSYKTDPGQEEWTTTEGLATLSMVVDGCAQQMVLQTDMEGMKFSGLGLTTYNRQTKKWQSSWIDNMAAQTSLTEGDMVDGELILTGSDMMHGVKTYMRNTTFNMTEKSFEWKMEMSQDGENYATMMTATYTKR